MTKITYIPGEIANAAIDEHGNRKPVTRTQHIFDDAKGKSQSEVNEELEEAVGTVDEKITAEKTRAEGVEGGLNTRLQTVEQLAEISISGGDAQIATGADFTNPDATKRAKVPTVGAIVDGLNDGVYDVSKRNPTGGPNSDGKFTLEYILSNADTLIPTGWRHGGMTISFVDSSDNKYVQWRYMSSSTAVADFTNLDNWQGVDEDVTVDSKNLVESGGVAKQFTLLTIDDLAEPNNGYYDDNGDRQSSSYYANWLINIEPSFKKIIAHLRMNTSNYWIAFFDKNGFISGEKPANISTNQQWVETVNIPEGATSCRVISASDDSSFNFVQIYVLTDCISLNDFIKKVEGNKLNKKDYNEDLINSSSNVIQHDWDAVTSLTYAGHQYFKAGHRYLIKLISTTGGEVKTLATYQNTTYKETIGGWILEANVPLYIRFNATYDANRMRVAQCPAMTTYLVDLDDVKDNVKQLSLMPNVLATLEDKASSIVWNVGEIRYGVPDATRTGYRYASPMLVKKGDIIIISSYYNMPQEFADVYLTDVNGSSYVAISKYVDSNNLLFISDKEQYISINIRYDATRNTYHWYSTDVYKEMIDYLSNYGVFYPNNQYKNTFENIKRAFLTGTNFNNQKFTLLHLSDIHGNGLNYRRLKDLITKYGSYIDDTIITGDLVGRSFQDTNDAILYTAGFEKILLSIGNHDVYDHNGDAPSVDDPDYWATGLEKYNRYFQNISQWGVTQPANAATLGLCYYYKDYDLTIGSEGTVTVPKLRLIVLDPYGYDAAQQSWLESTLADAKTNTYAVVIATHVPPVNGVNDCNYVFNTQWNSLSRLNVYGAYDDRYIISEGVSAMDAVDTFINGGGEFVCWLTGHVHYDKIMTITSHPNQIVVVIGTANGTVMPFSDMARTEFDYSYDLMNAISVDTYNKVLSIARIGVNTDIWLRKRNTISIDYVNRTLIADN